MGGINGISSEVSLATFFAPQKGVNASLGQFNAYVVFVLDENGNRVEGATVTCTNNDNSDTHSFITDSNGEALCEPFVIWQIVGNGVVESGYRDTNVNVTATGYVSGSFSFTPTGGGGYFTIVLTAKSGMLTKWDAVVVVDDIPEANENDTCYCLKDCEYRERVFTDGVGTSHWKNDVSTFLRRKITATDTITFELWKGGVKLTDIVSDTFGKYYSTFAAQSLYTGIVIEWYKVWSIYGFGNYQIKVQSTILGNAKEEVSRSFALRKYTDAEANNTVVIESYQTGNVLSSQFDYTGLLPNGWLQQWRVIGTFGDKTPSLETDRLEDTDRNTIQIQDKVINEYTLDVRQVTGEIFNAITQDAILGNVLLLTDFRVMAPEIFRRVSVRPTSFESTTDLQNRRIRTIIKLTDSKQNIVKRNF